MLSTAEETTVPAPSEIFNFAKHLLERNQSRHAKIAYLDEYGSMSYGKLDERVRRLAAALLNSHVRREERVLLLLHDRNEWPVSFLGAMYAGIVPVAVNTLLTPNDYAYMLEHSRSQLAIVSGELLPTLEEAMQKAEHELQSVVVVGDAKASALETINFEDFVAGTEPLAVPARTRRNDPGFWLYSSGSTGSPKGTVHTHANPYWTAELYGKGILGVREADVCFSAAKLFFAYGLGNALTFPLSVGAKTVLMAGRPTPDAVFRRWVEHQPTIFFGAPTGYAGLLASSNLPTSNSVSLRLCSSAGEALPTEIAEKFRSHFGIDICDGIGSTEMLHIFMSNTPGRVRYGTSGWPVPGYEIELRDENRQVVADGQIGDLYIKGPSAALTYWGQPIKSQETFQGAWMKSGDKYVRNEDGSYTCVGRSDDMFKVSGMFVSPLEVENMLVAHPSVLEAAVVGLPDADGLVKSKAFVVLKEGQKATESELQTFVKGRLAPYKYPRSVCFLDQLPKTATGKVMRYKLREVP
jgi:benzoate-CoA ligase